MHTSNNNVKKIARDIVMAYAHHIRDRVKARDEDYVLLGVDDDFTVYEGLFRSVAEKALGVSPHEVRLFTNSVVIETLDAIETVIKNKGFATILGNKILADCVFEVCLYILKKVKEEEFDDIDESYQVN